MPQGGTLSDCRLVHFPVAGSKKALGAAPHERTDDRRGYANGFKPKGLKTRKN